MEEKISLDWRKTRFALCGESGLGAAISLYTLIPFLLRKDLHASMFQISLFATLRPVLSVFSFLLERIPQRGQRAAHRQSRRQCRAGYLPFLFFPWAGNFWVLLLASAMYQLF